MENPWENPWQKSPVRSVEARCTDRAVSVLLSVSDPGRALAPTSRATGSRNGRADASTLRVNCRWRRSGH
jgi:hypothetical protein